MAKVTQQIEDNLILIQPSFQTTLFNLNILYINMNFNRLCSFTERKVYLLNDFIKEQESARNKFQKVISFIFFYLLIGLLGSE